MLAWPLVSRDRELHLITTGFGDGTSAGVVLAGHRGAGKTVLARHALDALTAAGVPTAWVLGTRSATPIPFGAMAHLLPPRPPAGAEPISVMCALIERVVELGGNGRVAIGVDDAHLLDEASAATLAQLVLRSAVFLVVTAPARRALPDALATLAKDGLLRRIELAPLPTTSIDALIDLSLDGPVAGLTRHRLRAECAGNPLALHEMLERGLETKALRRAHGLWWWHEDPRAADPVVGALPPHSGAELVFELVALAGTVPLRLVERLADQDAIEAAERDGLVRVERSANRFDLRATDPLGGSKVRETTPVSRTRGRFRSLSAAALAMPMRRTGDALRTACWQLEGGAPTRPDVLLAGAREALQRFDLRLAERLVRAGREGAPSPDANGLLAEILVWRGRGADATGLLASGRPAPARRRWAVLRVAARYSGSGELAEADRVPDVAGDPLVDATRSWILLLDGQCAQAWTLAQQVRAQPGDGAMPVAAAAGMAAAGLLGRPFASDQPSTMDTPMPLGLGMCLAQFGAGNLNAAWELADGGYHRAIRSGEPLPAGGWAALRGLVAAAQGRLGTADASLREAAIVLADGDPFRLRRWCLAGLALVAALTGNAAEGQNWLLRSDRIAGSSNRLFEPMVELCRAWTRATNGSIGGAVAAARRAAALGRAAGLPTIEGLALYDVARLAERTDVDRLAELAARVDTPVAAVLAAAATGLSTMDGELLADASLRFESLGHYLLAAETAYVAATALRRAGHRAGANVQIEKATALHEICAGARTRLLAPEDTMAVLTQREREVVLLAPTHSSRQIAALLGLTAHTVDNYLARGYAKLGVRGRAELRELSRGSGRSWSS